MTAPAFQTPSYKNQPPLRESPEAADRLDDDRTKYAHDLWHSQDDKRRKAERNWEYLLRMYAGQHWTVWNPWLSRFQDVSEWMTDEEQVWRQRPVINLMLYWYILTHARLTENQPIIAFQPSTGDRYDAMLAEAADTIHKTIWRQAGVNNVIDDVMGWVVACGLGYTISRVDPTKGDFKPWVGPAQLQLLDQYGQPTGIQRTAPMVPFDQNGQPLARLVGDGSAYEVTGQPHQEREGQIIVDVLSPFQVRGEWSNRPWHQKRWHSYVSYATPEEVWDQFGIEVEADTSPEELGHDDVIARVLLGTGYFGAAAGSPESGRGSGSSRADKLGLVRLQTLYQAPCNFPGMDETEQSPGGRLLITTKKKTLVDGPRPVAYPNLSPIREFGFVNLNGRPFSTTPGEMLAGLNRSINRSFSQVLEHTNLVANPMMVVDKDSGLGQVKITSRPGQKLEVRRKPGVPPIEFTQPPPLSADLWRVQDKLLVLFDTLGNIRGAEGTPPTQNASGQLVKELRGNSDRFLGAAARRNVEEVARMAEDWMVILPTLWTEEKILTLAGEDGMSRTLSVYPDLFKLGRVNVVPDPESMLPEGREEREMKVTMLYQQGVWGPPGTPDAARKYMEAMRFPHLSRISTVGEIHRVTARQENGKLKLGTPVAEIPVFEWYDSLVHLQEHELEMASPEFLKLDPAVQEGFVLHRMAHIQVLQIQAAQQLAQQVAQQKAMEPDADDGAGKKSPPKPAAAPAGAAA